MDIENMFPTGQTNIHVKLGLPNELNLFVRDRPQQLYTDMYFKKRFFELLEQSLDLKSRYHDDLNSEIDFKYYEDLLSKMYFSKRYSKDLDCFMDLIKPGFIPLDTQLILIAFDKFGLDSELLLRPKIQDPLDTIIRIKRKTNFIEINPIMNNSSNIGLLTKIYDSAFVRKAYIDFVDMLNTPISDKRKEYNEMFDKFLLSREENSTTRVTDFRFTHGTESMDDFLFNAYGSNEDESSNDIGIYIDNKTYKYYILIGNLYDKQSNLFKILFDLDSKKLFYLRETDINNESIDNNYSRFSKCDIIRGNGNDILEYLKAIDTDTIETHIQNIFTKYNINNNYCANTISLDICEKIFN